MDLPAFSLHKAQQAISKRITSLPTQSLPLQKSLGRIPAVSLKSIRPKPTFDQSTRDGYALAVPVGDNSKNNEVSFRIIGEIPAGRLDRYSLEPGQAMRIMTGAMVPRNCTQVVPFEPCREHDGHVYVPEWELKKNDFIRRRGSDLHPGRVVVAKGQPITPDHLLLLVENGYETVPVIERPEVHVLCTGSELVKSGIDMKAGQKISGNGLLLSSLVAQTGGNCQYVGIVDDQAGNMAEALRKCLAVEPHMIITTGGMGPGKFDLMEGVFHKLNGNVVYNRLKVRPGKTTLFGFIERTPLFALPGPPPAVRLLFHELVAPALRIMHGEKRVLPKAVRARLEIPLILNKCGRVSLKGGVASLKKETLWVRPAGKRDSVNAILMFAGRKRGFRAGEFVKLHLVDQVS